MLVCNGLKLEGSYCADFATILRTLKGNMIRNHDCAYEVCMSKVCGSFTGIRSAFHFCIVEARENTLKPFLWIIIYFYEKNEEIDK